DAAASSTATTTLLIAGVRVHDGVLQIIGTRGNDRVAVTRARHGCVKIDASFLPGAGSRTQSLAGVTLIDVVLGDGDDRADVAKDIRCAPSSMGVRAKPSSAAAAAPRACSNLAPCPAGRCQHTGRCALKPPPRRGRTCA